MLTLNRHSIKDKQAWAAAGVSLPRFDLDQMIQATEADPVWIHFGSGNIFRAFIARLQQDLLNQGLASRGIIASDTFDYDILHKIYTPFDNLTLLVSLKADGSLDKDLIASVADTVAADSSDARAMAKLRRIFTNPGLQIISFTITEKGYALRNLKGEYLPVVTADLKDGPGHARHAMSMVTALLWSRFQAGARPVAMCSMDNCSHNGEKLRNSVLEIARAWQAAGFVPAAFTAYVSDERQVSFPWSMIDKITPRPDATVQAMLTAAGIADMAPIVTSKNTFIAPFVNSEVPQYLVIEDRFPNGRPPLEKAGVYMTDRDTVNQTERMKVTTCLNPLHTALAVTGCLLGYKRISEEMRDPDLKALVEKIGYKEGMPVVTDPGILSPTDFIHEVIDVRLPNPFMPDTPQRIATDTSQKVGIRYGETIKSYLASTQLDVNTLTAIPFAIAAWLRYLLAVDDQGAAMACSSDPMLETLQQQLQTVKWNQPDSYAHQLQPILANAALFGSDLCACGLGKKIETYFVAMLAGPGSVRQTLKAAAY
ncbi:MAG: mannitol dehydrogenase family protein [Oscillospiraceae bacterium]|nr:mannitol dehydrogenase family protein [Oscillospiraceae bacterium]MDD4368786.1 mannitol dehydrogenase family protein [Oscillospiraceae bacterium]